MCFYFDDISYDYLVFKVLSFTLAMTNTQNPHMCLLMMCESPCCSSNMMHQEKADGKSDKGINPKRRSLLQKKQKKTNPKQNTICREVMVVCIHRDRQFYSMLLRYGVQNILLTPVNTPDLDVFFNILYR